MPHTQKAWNPAKLTPSQFDVEGSEEETELWLSSGPDNVCLALLAVNLVAIWSGSDR